MRKWAVAVLLVVVIGNAAPVHAGYEIRWHDCTSVQDYVATNVTGVVFVALWLLPRLFADNDLSPRARADVRARNFWYSVQVLGLGLTQGTDPIGTVNSLLHFGCMELAAVPE